MLAEENANFSEEDRDDQATSPFMNKREVINMHLEILYKSVDFLDADKIQGERLDEYKRQRDVKRQHEQLGYSKPQPKQRPRLVSEAEARAPQHRERSPSLEE